MQYANFQNTVLKTCFPSEKENLVLNPQSLACNAILDALQYKLHPHQVGRYDTNLLLHYEKLSVGLLGFMLLVSYFKNAVLSLFQDFSTKNKISSMENNWVCFMSKERRIPWDSQEVLGQGELAGSILLVDVHGNSFHHHDQTSSFPCVSQGSICWTQRGKPGITRAVLSTVLSPSWSSLQKYHTASFCSGKAHVFVVDHYFLPCAHSCTWMPS